MTDTTIAQGEPILVAIDIAKGRHEVLIAVSGKKRRRRLTMKKGRRQSTPQDYKRHGTATLFAALNVLTGGVLKHQMQRHRHQEFLRFLNEIERNVNRDMAIHAILDN